MADKDTEALEVLLELGPRAGILFSPESMDKVLEIHAEAGSTSGAETFLARIVAPASHPTLSQRHLHLKAYIRSIPNGHFPHTALALLHKYETANAPPPMKTYNSLVSSLFRVREGNLPLARRQAWDLFAHMRYVAHPDPDVQMYATMIRACASPISAARYQSEPERALDLWTEMTVDKRLEPSAGAYDAVILACTRSGQSVFIDHGFQLVKQMLDGHRDAFGKSRFQPTRRTFSAMLEGLKRQGNLDRTRWVIAEMARIVVSVGGGGVNEDVKGERDIDEDVMTHVFQAYAAYRPPTPRKLNAILNKEPQDQQQLTGTPALNSPSSLPIGSAISEYAPHIFADAPHVVPQSHKEVIAEVNLLFERVLSANNLVGSTTTTANTKTTFDRVFRHVKLTPKLVNSFLQVHHAHSLDTRKIQEVFDKLYSEPLNLQSNAETFVDALERCALQTKRMKTADVEQRAESEEVTLEWAESLWAKWQLTYEPGLVKGGREGRLVERAWVAWIKVLTT